MAFNAFSNKLSSDNKTKKEKTILIAAIVIILAGAGIVYFVFFRSSDTVEDTTLFEDASVFIGENLSTVSSETSLDQIIKEIDFDADFLRSSRFQALKTFKNWPLRIEQKGRGNPFFY